MPATLVPGKVRPTLGSLCAVASRAAMAQIPSMRHNDINLFTHPAASGAQHLEAVASDCNNAASIIASRCTDIDRIGIAASVAGTKV